MEPTDVPDLNKWTENHLHRTEVRDTRGNLIVLAKNFFRYDLKNPDKRFHKLMEQCLVIYAFGISCVGKCWITYADDGSGGIKKIVYSAILMDSVNSRWSIGLPDEIWSSENNFDDDKKIIGLTVRLKTAEGEKSVYVKNPGYKK